MTTSACLSDDELAVLVATADATDPRLHHVQMCDGCRAIWLNARDVDTPTWMVGRYEVRGPLGAGGLGVVLLGWDPVLRREVAIKFPSAAHTGALLREAQALAAIRHRNVVAVHDYGEVEGDVYFAMERVHGVPFDTAWLAMANDERLRALIDVAEGLAAIHTAGLVHCDIKPANIIVTPAGDVMIVDLGLAVSHIEPRVFSDAATRSSSPGPGTPGYRAPEVEHGASATPASDQYAFWCVVRQCLADAKLGARRRRTVDALIARGTSADPRRRFDSMAACAVALGRLRERRRWLIAGAAVAATLGVAMVGSIVMMRDSAAACTEQLTGWSVEVRERVAHQLGDRPEVRDRVLAFVDDAQRTGRELLAQACEVPDDDPVAKTAALRSQWCVMSSWQWIAGYARAIGDGRNILELLDELPSGVPIANCTPGSVTANPPAVRANATEASRTLLAEIQRTDGLPPDERLPLLDALGRRVTAIENAGLRATWHIERAETYRQLGKQHEALEDALAAVEVATRNGDDVVLARARLRVYILRDVSDRSDATRDGEVEAIVARAGSPALLATFHNVAGQRALARGDVARARALFERSVETLGKLELAPSMMHGAVQLNLGSALLYTQDYDAARSHYDRAVEIFTARLGATHDETVHARTAAATCLMHSGRVEDSARALATLSADLAGANRSHTVPGAHVAMARCQVEQALDAKGVQADGLHRCKEALEVHRAVYGTGRVELVSPMLAVAQLTMATSVSDALPILEQAIAIAEQHAGHPTDLPYARGLLALALKVTGKPAEGYALAQKVVADLDRFGQRALAEMLRAQFPALRSPR
ncbi:MAG: tetratricopeptide repeat protein [Kofleriaceae bacterium]